MNPWWRAARWRRVPTGLALIAAVLVGLIVSVFDAGLRPYLAGGSILLLDLAGAVYSWRAAPHSPNGVWPWRLIAMGRAASVGTTVCLTIAAYTTATSAWYWIGIDLRLLMYALLAAGTLYSGFKQVTGRARGALLAETVTVLAAGFMVIWYFALEPALENQNSTTAVFAMVAWPLGDVLLLAAVASVALRGAITRFAVPVTTFVSGLAVYLAVDVIWSPAAGGPGSYNPGALVSLVVACLLMTAAPVFTVACAELAPFTRRTSRSPAWATHLPMAAMLIGCLLMFVVILAEGQLLPWGGLILGLIVMTCAAGVRQLISLRESRAQIATDTLTGLANRLGLDEALSRMTRRDEPVAVLLIDLDGFKLVNDAYGHAAGDDFLVHFAHRLRSSVRRDSVCARIGGDEFAVLLPGISRVEQALVVAERVPSATAVPSGVLSSSATKLRSILRMSTGSRVRYCRDEYPVPKSSMAMRMPCSRSARYAKPLSPADLAEFMRGREEPAVAAMMEG